MLRAMFQLPNRDRVFLEVEHVPRVGEHIRFQHWGQEHAPTVYRVIDVVYPVRQMLPVSSAPYTMLNVEIYLKLPADPRDRHYVETPTER